MVLENDLEVLGAEATAFLDREHGLHIGGAQVLGSDGFSIVDPTSGRVVSVAAEASPEQVGQAVSCARKALQGPWSSFRPHEREQCLLRLADLVEANQRELSEIEAVCSGRLLANTRGIDVGYSAHVLRYMGGWATKIAGQAITPSIPYIPDGHFSGFALRRPVGVVAAIVPWNVALGLAVWKVAPALAAGCTIVLKPSPQSPLTALRLAELALEAGIPEGVVNVVTGRDSAVGAALVRHPGVDMVSFTGSTDTGSRIAVDAAASLKRCNLELGGKSPLLIMEDADLDRAIPAAAWAIFANHGQNCCAGSRLYVHESRYQDVLAGVAEIAEAIQLGSPLDETSTMGPLVSEAQQQRVLGFVAEGKREGARLVAGGVGLEHPGAYVVPTVLADVEPQMQCVREEIFGPVLVAAPFASEEEAIRLANDSRYGLGASIWSKDFDRIGRMTEALQAGAVWVNVHNALDVALPFGGWKSSGPGVDLSEQAVLAHTKIKTAVHHYC